ncbi:hypothetical protein MCHI_003517 [Candidatus Magnetoovum chiemensis]|nr:hypothetical protein MCHI_003517 [Candidatus Magnetoovum chiemensis]
MLDEVVKKDLESLNNIIDDLVENEQLPDDLPETVDLKQIIKNISDTIKENPPKNQILKGLHSEVNKAIAKIDDINNQETSIESKSDKIKHIINELISKLSKDTPSKPQEIKIAALSNKTEITNNKTTNEKNNTDGNNSSENNTSEIELKSQKQDKEPQTIQEENNKSSAINKNETKTQENNNNRGGQNNSANNSGQSKLSSETQTNTSSQSSTTSQVNDSDTNIDTNNIKNNQELEINIKTHSKAENIETKPDLNTTETKSNPRLFTDRPLPKTLQINNNLFTVTRKGQTTIEVRLEPKGMGKLDIEVNIEKGVVNTHISAANSTGKEIIERNAQNIIQELLKDGLNVGGFSVALKDKRGGLNQEKGQNNQNGQSDDGQHTKIIATKVTSAIGRVNIFI